MQEFEQQQADREQQAASRASQAALYALKGARCVWCSLCVVPAVCGASRVHGRVGGWACQRGRSLSRPRGRIDSWHKLSFVSQTKAPPLPGTPKSAACSPSAASLAMAPRLYYRAGKCQPSRTSVTLWMVAGSDLLFSSSLMARHVNIRTAENCPHNNTVW